MENELKYEFILLFSVVIIKRDNLNAENIQTAEHNLLYDKKYFSMVNVFN